MDFLNYKSRCHDLGKYVPTKNPQKAIVDKASIVSLYEYLITGNRPEIGGNKFIKKGKLMEPGSIQMIQDLIFPLSNRNNTFISGEKYRVDDEYLSGEVDLFHAGMIMDVKNSWSYTTFIKADLSHLYEWQLRAYLRLHRHLDIENAYLVYTLQTMPEEMMQKEADKLFYYGDYPSYESKEFQDAREEFIANHNYDHIPIEKRIKIFEVKRRESDDLIIENTVLQIRSGLMKIHKEQEELGKKNLDLFSKAQTEKIYGSLPIAC